MSFIERLGIGLENFIQRRLTPAAERDLLERDLIRQRESSLPRQSIEPTEREVEISFRGLGTDPSDTLAAAQWYEQVIELNREAEKRGKETD